MRTSIFNKFADLPQEFRDDFATLWDLPEQQRTRLTAYVSELFKAGTTGQCKKITDRAVSEIGGPAPPILRLLKLLQFISQEWNPMNDTPEDFLRDLGELALVPSEKAAEGHRFLLDFLSVVQADNQRRLQKIYASSLLPSLVGVSCLVDFRAIMERPFGSGLEDAIEQYQPRCLGFAPVIIVSVKCDSGHPNNFKFQCEPQELRIMMDQLQAALKDFESAKLSLPGGTE